MMLRYNAGNCISEDGWNWLRSFCPVAYLVTCFKMLCRMKLLDLFFLIYLPEIHRCD
jgi:hypothetical protein